MPLPLLFQIAKYYPKKSIVMGVQDEYTGLWSSALVILENDETLGETIFSFENYRHPEQSGAMMEMHRICQHAKNNVVAMSN